MKKINIAFYDTKPYDKESFLLMNKNFGFNIEFFDFHLNEKTAFSSKGFNVICAFVNDILDETDTETETIVIKTLEDISNLAKKHKERLLAFNIESYIRPISIEQGKLICSLVNLDNNSFFGSLVNLILSFPNSLITSASICDANVQTAS